MQTMQPYTVHKSAGGTWTSTPVHFGGREYRRVRFSNGVRVTWAIWERKSASVATGTCISRRRPAETVPAYNTPTLEDRGIV